MQKVMVKGLAHDDKSLRESGISNGSKVMVIGSTFDDVLALSHQTATVLLYYLFIVSLNLFLIFQKCSFSAISGYLKIR